MGVSLPDMPEVPGQASKKRLKGAGKTIASVVVLVAIFWLGLSIGNGSLSVGTSPISANNDLPADLDYSEVERVYDLLRENYDGELQADELIDGLKSGLVRATGDTYSEYFNAEAAKEFNEQLSGSFSGIGAELGRDDEDNLIIVAPISGFPAEKAGLRAQDIILTVDGASTTNMSIHEAVTQIRGPEGTDVTLGILRGNSERKEITITRDNIKIPSVEHEIKEGNIGYIDVTQFWTDTASLTVDAAREFQQNGVNKVVLDLRGNPGGSLDAAVDLASLWLEEGETVLEERRDGQTTHVYKSSGNTMFEDMETVVLIDQGSASASEIVAGALKDNGVATLIGQTSYGKGSVQQILTLNDGGELKVTIARWYRPSGENIDEKGIKPDQVVRVNEDDIAAERDPQLNAALGELQ